MTIREETEVLQERVPSHFVPTPPVDLVRNYGRKILAEKGTLA
jgi:hypothetical protein